MIVIRQFINLVLLVPRAIYQLATSAVTAITHAIGSALGITQPATAAAAAKNAAVQPDRTSVAQAAPRPKQSVPRITSDKPTRPKAGASASAFAQPKVRHSGRPAARPPAH